MHIILYKGENSFPLPRVQGLALPPPPLPPAPRAPLSLLYVVSRRDQLQLQLQHCLVFVRVLHLGRALQYPTRLKKRQAIG